MKDKLTYHLLWPDRTCAETEKYRLCVNWHCEGLGDVDCLKNRNKERLGANIGSGLVSKNNLSCDEATPSTQVVAAFEIDFGGVDLELLYT